MCFWKRLILILVQSKILSDSLMEKKTLEEMRSLRRSQSSLRTYTAVLTRSSQFPSLTLGTAFRSETEVRLVFFWLSGLSMTYGGGFAASVIV